MMTKADPKVLDDATRQLFKDTARDAATLRAENVELKKEIVGLNAVISHLQLQCDQLNKQLVAMGDFVQSATQRAKKESMSTSEAVKYAKARAVSCTPQSVRNWCEEYGIGVQDESGEWRVDTHLFDAFIEDRKRA
jgi:hypothetical protein